MNQSVLPYHILLASQSPRRQELLTKLDASFEIVKVEVEEVYPPALKKEEVALYLCKLKADAFAGYIPESSVLVTADTIVCVDDFILGKPAAAADAMRMLRILSGRKHDVITAVCIRTEKIEKAFYVTSSVYFKPLSEEDITYYVNKYKPFDKAGAYGVQEWIGLVGIERIEGSYFNVMGLPVKELYEEIKRL